MQKRMRIAASVLGLMLTLAALPASAATETPLVTPALAHLAADADMAKAGLVSGEITFTAADFARALNRAKVGAITVTALPPAAEGKLKLGSADVYAGQTVARAALDLLRFVPANAAVTTSAFSFTPDGAGYAIDCTLYLLPALNFAPTTAVADERALTVSTHRAIACHGSLPGYDPEGDALRYEIVNAPKKGSVTLTDPSHGDYRYTPLDGKTGRDSFTYVVRDRYGNYSAAETVEIEIVRPQTAVVFADMEGHWAHNAALTAVEAGLMQPKQLGDSYCFNPDEAVSRGEFLVMAMQAKGIDDLPTAASTGFADDAAIPAAMKGYVAAARELGYIRGRDTEAGAVFAPSETITRAEAAVMLGNILDAAVPVVKPSWNDAEAVPTWAEDALAAMSAMGVMKGTGSGAINASATLDRAQAATILCAMLG